MSDTTVYSGTSSEETTRANEMRVALLVEYCGRPFSGSQFQPNRPTVQSTVQHALRQLNVKASAVTFAGRTDAGVHALGQVAHFDAQRDAFKHIGRLDSALNAVLPETVSVRSVHLDAGFDFHSRRDALCRWYRYTIYNGSARSVWASRRGAAHYHKPLDADLMQQAAQLILGSHDFSSFKDSDTDVTNNVCDILYAQVFRDADFVVFDIVADRFLYKMVRNLTGQLMAIGQTDNPLPPETILDVLAKRDRRQAAATASPEGLTLMAIRYKPPFHFFAQDPTVRQLETLISSRITQTRMESPQNEKLFRKAS
jgi:tRNA pseudouridine38-40 synthase